MVKSSSQKRKKGAAFKKSPEAPKRFKSSYILYFTHVHDTLKKTLPQDQATVRIWDHPFQSIIIRPLNHDFL